MSRAGRPVGWSREWGHGADEHREVVGTRDGRPLRFWKNLPLI